MEKPQLKTRALRYTLLAFNGTAATFTVKSLGAIKTTVPVDRAREQPGLRLHPTLVLAQGFEQLRAERNVAITTAFAALNFAGI